jgi:hypothetical protein
MMILNNFKVIKKKVKSKLKIKTIKINMNKIEDILSKFHPLFQCMDQILEWDKIWLEDILLEILL